MSIRLKRIYDGAEAADGYRVLVDRVWPRGVSKRAARLDAWLKEVAPSTGLRMWFGHDPLKWKEFKRRYGRELAARTAELEALALRARRARLTLLFGARDTRFNQAVALKDYLERRGRPARPRARGSRRSPGRPADSGAGAGRAPRVSR